MIQRESRSFDKLGTLSCDANCGKAWGIAVRPREQLGTVGDPDDFAFLADGELGEAPVDPGTYEGGHGKPEAPEQRLNKWCSRQCERSVWAPEGEALRLPDFGRRLFNNRTRRLEADAAVAGA